ncbi:hypothetical protein FHS44_002321 [Streptosporangium saharense]|uniref:Uncharacterized protein n=1 Tax=Streptosporangium saharense TaxID=1706840 RepID=A0A7W7QLE6_9ACTN|nr:hypothetical protein [Streptosporangium saharense]
MRSFTPGGDLPGRVLVAALVMTAGWVVYRLLPGLGRRA